MLTLSISSYSAFYLAANFFASRLYSGRRLVWLTMDMNKTKKDLKSFYLSISKMCLHELFF